MVEDDPRITVGDHEDANRFEIHRDGELAGFLDYVRSADRLRITHTEIDTRFRGHGLGARLVHGAIDGARQEGVTVVPECSFVRGWLDEHPEYADVVAD